MIAYHRITYRNTKGKPGFKDVPAAQITTAMRVMADKGYTMIIVNPQPFMR